MRVDLAVAERSVSVLLMLLGRLGLLHNVPEAVLTAGARRHKTAPALTLQPGYTVSRTC